MRNRQITLSALALAGALVAFTPGAKAAGFLIYDLSSEALGKGSAVTASVDEPAAVWFNPAALPYTKKDYGVSVTGIYINANSAFKPSRDHAGPNAYGPTTSSIHGHHALPTLFAKARVVDWFHIGVGVYSAFGLALDWPDDWSERQSAIESAITTVGFGPVFAFQLWKDRLSAGVGFESVRAAVELKTGLPDVMGGHVRLGGGTFGFGANVSLMFRLMPQVMHIGFMYRSRVKLSFKGKADFAPDREEFNHDLPDTGGDADVTLPDIIAIGLMFRPIEKLVLTIDVNVVMWSTFKELAVDFENAGTPDIALERNWKNSVTLRIGADLQLPVKGLRARLGFIFDQNPSPKRTLSPTLPDANRVDFGAGIGYEYKWLKLDLGYLFVYFLPSKAEGGHEPEGTYRSNAHLLGLTFTAHFDRPKKPQL